MKCYDFWYDGLKLSDFGFQICKFDSDKTNTVSNGSEITFNKASVQYGARQELTSIKYENPITATIQICKNLCDGSAYEITVDEMQNIMTWLNRKSFHKFKLIEDEYTDVYFEASFNVSRIEIGGRLCGFELAVTTNRPFGLKEPVELVIENNDTSSVRSFYSTSDDEGFIYPNMEIEVKGSGDLDIYSITEDRHTVVKNCLTGEIITVNYPMISTSSTTHKIQNDFNWVFYRVSTSYRDTENKFTTSLPCVIKITYSPVAKVGI